jgi:hypothetical protein
MDIRYRAQAFASLGGDSDCVSLTVVMPKTDWYFRIRRVDARSDKVFSNYHGTEFLPENVAAFLPLWATADWIRVSNAPDRRSESYARNGVYALLVCAAMTSARNHEDVIKSFLDYMA